MNTDADQAEAVPCPAMDNLFSIAFEAHNSEQNHHRHYAVTLGRDLLDHWTVAIRYGRTGQAGQERRYAAAEPEAIRAIIRDRLRRRLSAPRMEMSPCSISSAILAWSE